MYVLEGYAEPYTLPFSLDFMILRVMSLGNPDLGIFDIPRILSVSGNSDDLPRGVFDHFKAVEA